MKKQLTPNQEPNWGLAFGSGSFLLVWCIGILASVPIEIVAVRTAIATVLGAGVGLLFGKVIVGLKAMFDEPAKGGSVDFTVPASDDELLGASELSSVVPQADSAEPAPFEPLDFKVAARQVQSLMQE